MKKIILALASLTVLVGQAFAAGVLINGSQINPQTAISISTLTVTGATGLTATSNITGPGTGLTGTAASLTAGHVTTNANLTGDVTSVGNTTTAAATQANITALSNAAGVNIAHGITASSGTFTNTSGPSVQTSSNVLISGTNNGLCFGSVSPSNCMYAPASGTGVNVFMLTSSQTVSGANLQTSSWTISNTGSLSISQSTTSIGSVITVSNNANCVGVWCVVGSTFIPTASAVSSITFSGIAPSSGTIWRITWFATVATSASDLYITFNNDNSSVYNWALNNVTANQNANGCQATQATSGRSVNVGDMGSGQFTFSQNNGSQSRRIGGYGNGMNYGDASSNSADAETFSCYTNASGANLSAVSIAARNGASGTIYGTFILERFRAF